jgi:hypothetical protein
MSRFGEIFSEVYAKATSLGKGAGSVLFDLVADAAGVDDPNAETSAGEESYGQAGFIIRPHAQDASGGWEAIASRRDDGLTPIASRDLRIVAARGPVAIGSVGFAGYGGGHASFEDAPTGGGNIFNITLPYDFSGSPPVGAKSHTIVIDTTTGSESIKLLHGKGAYIEMLPDGSVSVVSSDGSTTIKLTDGGVTMGSTTGQQPTARATDTVIVMFPPVIQVAGTLNGLPFVGIATITSPAVGVIQTGSATVSTSA